MRAEIATTQTNVTVKRNNSKNWARLPFVAIAAAVIFGNAHAAVVSVDTRADLNANDLVDWSIFGDSLTPVASGSTIPSQNGLVVTVALVPSGDSLERRDQNSGWAGNFDPGDALIWTRSDLSHTLEISFSAPIQGAGFNIQRDTYGSFIAAVESFDLNNLSLGLIFVSGDSTGAGDGSAPFLGFLSDSAEISRIEIGLYESDTPQFAINQLSIVTGDSVIPEPTTTLGLGLLFAAGFLTRSRSRAK